VDGGGGVESIKRLKGRESNRPAIDCPICFYTWGDKRATVKGGDYGQRLASVEKRAW